MALEIKATVELPILGVTGVSGQTCRNGRKLLPVRSKRGVGKDGAASQTSVPRVKANLN